MIRYRILLLLVFPWLAAVAAAQSLPPLEAYGALPTVDLMAISPSGERIAYRLTTDEQDAIVVLDLGTRQVVGGIAVGDIAARSLEFLDDENLLIIAGRATSALGFRGKFEASAAFHLNIEKGEINTLLARARDLYPAQSGLGQIIAVIDNGKRLLMPAFHAENLHDGAPSYGVYSVKLSSNRARLIERGTQDTVDWFAGADGELLARVDYSDNRNLYRIWNIQDDMKQLHEVETAIKLNGPIGLVPDGDALVYTMISESTDHTAYFRMSLEDGTIDGPVLDKDRASVESVLSDLNRVVYGVRFSGFRPSYGFFDHDVSARVQRIVNELSDSSARLVSWSANFEDLLFHISGGWSPGLYVLFRADSPNPEMLANARPDIPNEVVVPTREIRYTAGDGLEIPALVTATPELREQGNAPLLVLPHGGPASYDQLEFDWLAQYFASRGYVVLQPQFRGSSGFGDEFKRAGHGEWGGKMQSDIDDGVDHLIASGLVDPERICIAGASYGGYAALAAGAFSPDKYRCVASIAGLSDLERFLKTARRDYGSRHWVVSYWQRQTGGDYFDNEQLEAISPINFVDDFKAPVLLLHGKNDTVVSIEQSRLMERALQKADKEVTLVEFDGEDHWLSYSESRLATLRALADFIDEHL